MRKQFWMNEEQPTFGQSIVYTDTPDDFAAIAEFNLKYPENPLVNVTRRVAVARAYHNAKSEELCQSFGNSTIIYPAADYLDEALYHHPSVECVFHGPFRIYTNHETGNSWTDHVYNVDGRVANRA